MRQIKRIILSVIILFGVPIASFITYTIISNDYCVNELAKSYQPFDAHKWIVADAKGAAGTQKEYRILAIDDLLSHKNFKGQTKAQIVALLGQPIQTDKYKNYDMVYWLGPDRSCMRIDSEWLVFTLENEQVKSYRVIADHGYVFDSTPYYL